MEKKSKLFFFGTIIFFLLLAGTLFASNFLSFLNPKLNLARIYVDSGDSGDIGQYATGGIWPCSQDSICLLGNGCYGIMKCVNGEYQPCDKGDPLCCSNGETQSCATSDGCLGSRNCVNSQFGTCIKNDPKCAACATGKTRCADGSCQTSCNGVCQSQKCADGYIWSFNYCSCICAPNTCKNNEIKCFTNFNGDFLSGLFKCAADKNGCFVWNKQKDCEFGCTSNQKSCDVCHSECKSGDKKCGVLASKTSYLWPWSTFDFYKTFEIMNCVYDSINKCYRWGEFANCPTGGTGANIFNQVCKGDKCQQCQKGFDASYYKNSDGSKKECGQTLDACGCAVTFGDNNGVCPGSQQCGDLSNNNDNKCVCPSQCTGNNGFVKCGSNQDCLGKCSSCAKENPNTPFCVHSNNTYSCSSCEPKTCQQLGKDCGVWDNGCDNLINCGGVQYGKNVCLTQGMIDETKTCDETSGKCGIPCHGTGKDCEYCDGNTGTWKTITYSCDEPFSLTNKKVCRSSANFCDIAETCDGKSPDCPKDEIKAKCTVNYCDGGTEYGQMVCTNGKCAKKNIKNCGDCQTCSPLNQNSCSIQSSSDVSLVDFTGADPGTIFDGNKEFSCGPDALLDGAKCSSASDPISDSCITGSSGAKICSCQSTDLVYTDPVCKSGQCTLEDIPPIFSSSCFAQPGTDSNGNSNAGIDSTCDVQEDTFQGNVSTIINSGILNVASDKIKVARCKGYIATEADLQGKLRINPGLDDVKMSLAETYNAFLTICGGNDNIHAFQDAQDMMNLYTNQVKNEYCIIINPSKSDAALCLRAILNIVREDIRIVKIDSSQSAKLDEAEHSLLGIVDNNNKYKLSSNSLAEIYLMLAEISSIKGSLYFTSPASYPGYSNGFESSFYYLNLALKSSSSTEKTSIQNSIKRNKMILLDAMMSRIDSGLQNAYNILMKNFPHSLAEYTSNCANPAEAVLKSLDFWVRKSDWARKANKGIFDKDGIFGVFLPDGSLRIFTENDAEELLRQKSLILLDAKTGLSNIKKLIDKDKVDKYCSYISAEDRLSILNEVNNFGLNKSKISSCFKSMQICYGIGSNTWSDSNTMNKCNELINSVYSTDWACKFSDVKILLNNGKTDSIYGVKGFKFIGGDTWKDKSINLGPINIRQFPYEVLNSDQQKDISYTLNDANFITLSTYPASLAMQLSMAKAVLAARSLLQFSSIAVNVAGFTVIMEGADCGLKYIDPDGGGEMASNMLYTLVLVPGLIRALNGGGGVTVKMFDDNGVIEAVVFVNDKAGFLKNNKNIVSSGNGLYSDGKMNFRLLGPGEKVPDSLIDVELTPEELTELSKVGGKAVPLSCNSNPAPIQPEFPNGVELVKDPVIINKAADMLKNSYEVGRPECEKIPPEQQRGLKYMAKPISDKVRAQNGNSDTFYIDNETTVSIFDSDLSTLFSKVKNAKVLEIGRIASNPDSALNKIQKFGNLSKILYSALLQAKARGAKYLVSITNQADAESYRRLTGGTDATAVIDANPAYIKSHNLVKENGHYREILDPGPPETSLQYEFTLYDIDTSLPKVEELFNRWCR